MSSGSPTRWPVRGGVWFQQIEGAGGMAAALESRLVQDRIADPQRHGSSDSHIAKR